MRRQLGRQAIFACCLVIGIAAGGMAVANDKTLPRAGNAVTGAGADIDFGDDSSQWANDGECDDPRFEGTGMHGVLLDEDLKRDATDCRAALAAGTVRYTGGTSAAAAKTPVGTPHPSGIDFGDDSSQWANDDECDDPRFRGRAASSVLISEDLMKDASDCRAAFDRGELSFREVYRDSYAAGAPFSTEGIDFGSNDSQWANDDECDDPRFEGPGTGITVDPAGLLADADDCRKAFIAGRAALRPQDEIDRIGQE